MSNVQAEVDAYWKAVDQAVADCRRESDELDERACRFILDGLGVESLSEARRYVDLGREYEQASVDILIAVAQRRSRG